MNNQLCDVCKTNPAVYGDGVTWRRCAGCQMKYEKNDTPPQQTQIQEGVEHKTIAGLTSIIIPVHMANYALFHYTGHCIGSVREHTDKQITPYELIVVDNGSPIKPPKNESYYADKLIVWKENKGVTKAWNAGIRMSFGEYIVLLNNDAQVYRGWLETMKKVLDSGLDLVMAKPMYSLTEPFARAMEAKRESDKWSNVEISESFEKAPTDFACVMFKKSLVDELGYSGVGLFREEMMNYCSDIDLLKRMEQAGKKYAVCKAVPIHHIIDATGAALSETPNIMNKDKEAFAKLWEKPVEPVNSNGVGAVQEQPAEDAKPEVKPLVRSKETGDKIFFIKDDTIHWIKSPMVLEALGYTFGDEHVVDKSEFSKYEYGEPISMENVEKFK